MASATNSLQWLWLQHTSRKRRFVCFTWWLVGLHFERGFGWSKRVAFERWGVSTARVLHGQCSSSSCVVMEAASAMCVCWGRCTLARHARLQNCVAHRMLAAARATCLGGGGTRGAVLLVGHGGLEQHACILAGCAYPPTLCVLNGCSL